jgi:2-hydroxychromene-2-carboxylate isomerase
MGELIYLDERRADRSRPTLGGRPAFFFDVSCPLSYLTAERIERTLGDVDWVPVAAGALCSVGVARAQESGDLSDVDAPSEAALTVMRERAEARARSLRLPLVWPDAYSTGAPCALRAAAYAVEIGAGAPFALAASRLAFCGGFDLDDPETLAEAAAAAGVPLDECLKAAGDTGRDRALLATADSLRARGVKELPAIRVGKHWFEGDTGLLSACGMLRRPVSYGLAPAG